MIHGKRIVITRPPHKAQAFADQLAALGAIPLVMPLIAIEPLDDTSTLDDALGRLAEFDWVIFTSANTVRHVCSRIKTLGIDPQFPKIAAVGSATANALAKYGHQANMIPPIHTAEGLYHELGRCEKLAGQRILLPQGNLAPTLLRDLLHEANAHVEQVTAYLTKQAKESGVQNKFDAITFTSSSTVNNYCERFSEPIATLGNAIVACIGPVTANTAREAGLPVHLVADPHTIDGLVTGLQRYFERITTL